MMWVLHANTLLHFFKGEGRLAESVFQKAPAEIGIPTERDCPPEGRFKNNR